MGAPSAEASQQMVLCWVWNRHADQQVLPSKAFSASSAVLTAVRVLVLRNDVAEAVDAVEVVGGGDLGEERKERKTTSLGVDLRDLARKKHGSAAVRAGQA